jgi:hypothetical protein
MGITVECMDGNFIVPTLQVSGKFITANIGICEKVQSGFMQIVNFDENIRNDEFLRTIRMEIPSSFDYSGHIARLKSSCVPEIDSYPEFYLVGVETECDHIIVQTSVHELPRVQYEISVLRFLLTKLNGGQLYDKRTIES